MVCSFDSHHGLQYTAYRSISFARDITRPAARLSFDSKLPMYESSIGTCTANVQLFKHGFDGYMKYAWPAVSRLTFPLSKIDRQDELGPLSCGPLYRDPNPHNVGLNDVHANISLTLIDNLTTLPLIYPSAFPDALEKVVTTVSFDQDVKVQVFELTIRALGSLLSTYQYLEKLPDDPRLQASTLGIKGEVDVKRHMGRLLEMALDLGNRFLPAFDTPTGIPYARINLRHGLLPGESTDTCA